MAMKFEDLKNITHYYEQSIYPKWLQYYKLYYWDWRERRQYIKQWQSNEPAKIFARIVDTFRSRMYDNKFRFYVSPTSDKDVEKAQLVQDLLTRAIQVSDLREKFWRSARDTLIIWEWYWRLLYSFEKTKVEYINPKTWKKQFYTKNLEYPDYKYVSPFDIMVDPAAPSFEESRYIVNRRLLTAQQIQKEYKYLFEFTASDVKELLWNWNYLFTKDWNLLKLDALYQNILTDVSDINDEVTFNDKKYFEVVEYWEDDKLIIWINWKEFYNGINPLPIKKKPFVQVTYVIEPGSPRWLWLWFYLAHIEKIGTALQNAFLDDVKLKANPVVKRRIWLNAALPNDVLEIEPGAVIPVEDPNDLLVMELWRVNYDLQNVYQFLLAEAMMIAWVNDIVMWWPLMKVDRSATSSASRVEAFKARMLSFFDSINRALWKIAEFWLAMVIAYNKWKDFTFKVFDDERRETIFKTIKLEDIEWQFDIIFDTEALKSALRDIALQKKLNFLQIASQLAIDPISRRPLIDLWKLVESIALDMDLPDILTKQQKEITPQEQQEPVQQQSVQQQTSTQQTENIEQKLLEAVDEATKVAEQSQTESQWEPPTEQAQLAKELLQEALNINW